MRSKGSITSTLPWRVRRRWLPHREGKGVRRRIGGKTGLKRRAKILEWMDVPLEFDVGGLVVALAVLAFMVTAILFGVPLVLLGIDLIWVLGALAVGAFARFVLGHPWRVEAVRGDDRFTWQVQGFRRAGRTRDLIRRRVDAGFEPDDITPSDPLTG